MFYSALGGSDYGEERRELVKIFAEIIDEEACKPTGDREAEHIANEKAWEIVKCFDEEVLGLARAALAEHLDSSDSVVASDRTGEPKTVGELMTEYENGDPLAVIVYEARDLIPIADYLRDLDI